MRRRLVDSKGLMIALILAAAVGAVLQRLAGMGFALVVAPVAVLVFGPLQGIVLVNACGVISALVVWAATREKLEWKRLGWLVALSPLGAVGGLLVANWSDTTALYMAIGIVLVISVMTSFVLQRVSWSVRDSGALAAATGFATGALVTSVGVGAPPLSTYAVLTRWNHGAFAATMQPLTVVISSIATAVALLGPGSLPHVTPLEAALMVISIIAGSLASIPLARRISGVAARYLVLSVALIGALTILFRGVTMLLSA